MKNVSCVKRVYRVTDNGTVYYVTAKRELSHELTNELLREDMELKTFLENYDVLISAELGIEYIKPEIEKERKKEKSVIRSIKRVKSLSMEDRISIVENELPEIFGMHDFIDNLKEKGYSYKSSRSMWKGTIEALRDGHKIKKIQDGEKNKTKYRLIKESETENIGESKEKEVTMTLHGRYASKVDKFINYRFERGRDFSTVELAEYLGIEHKLAGQIVYRLKKQGLIVRSNPEMKDKQKYRYVKTEKEVEHERELIGDVKDKEKETEMSEVESITQ